MGFKGRLYKECMRIYLELVCEGTQYELGEFRSGEDGPSLIKARLPDEFKTASLTEIRKATHWFSGKIGKRRKKTSLVKTGREKLNAIVSNSTSKQLSSEYVAYIDSKEWKARASKHRSEVDWHCQVCGKQHGAPGSLDVHHNTYGPLDGNEPTWSIIAVCHDTCHPICDYLRQTKTRDNEGDVDFDLFAIKPHGSDKCCHDSDIAECDDCMVESDFQHDCNRESRYF